MGTSIKGIGRRYANIVLKKADIPMTKRAGELGEEDVEKIITIMQNPRQYKIPDWFLNRQRDHKDGKTNQVMANGLDNKMREDLERLKKIRAHRGLRHYWCLQEEGRLIFNRNPLFPRKEMYVHVCKELLRMFARSPKRNICHLPSSFFGRELFLAFVSIFYVNSFYIEFVPSRSFSASHRKKTSFLWHCHRH